VSQPPGAATTGVLYAWGANHTGQATGVPGEDQGAPAPVPGLPPVVQAVCNACTALALDAEGRVWSWGWNHGGLLGRGPHPTQMQAIWTPAALRRRGHRMFAPSAEPPTPAPQDDDPDWDGGPEWDEALQMLQSAADRAPPPPALQGACPPQAVQGLPPIAQIAIGDAAALALDREGGVWAWGEHTLCGLPSSQRMVAEDLCWTPVRVSGLERIRHISLHPEGTAAYAVDAAGTAWSWGQGWEGELGQGKRRSDAVPAPIVFSAPVRTVAAGAFCALALLEDGTAWGWGNAQAHLGFHSPKRNTLRVLAPVPVQGLAGAVRGLWLGGNVAVYRLENGDSYVCGTGLDLLREAWADEFPAQPLRAPELDGWADFFVGGSHGFAIDGQGHAWGFGRVECGALANGEDAEDVLRAPLPIAALPGRALALAAAGHSSLALCGA